MIETLFLLSGFAEDGLRIALLVFLRVGAAMAVLPGFGEQMVPLRIRLALTMAFSVLIYPMAAPDLAPLIDGSLIALGAVEVAAGLIFGIFLRLMVHSLQIAGSIAAQSVSLSQILGPTANDPVPALGQVLVIGGLALAVLLGLHLRLTEYLALSYVLLPPGLTPDAAIFVDIGIAQVARVFSLGLSLAAPFVIGSLIYNVALGVINRAMPQLMVAFVGAPALTAGGLILLLLSAPFILQLWVQALFSFIDSPGGSF